MLSSKYLKFLLSFILLFKNFVSAQVQDPHVDLYEVDPVGFLSVVIFGHIFVFCGLIGVTFILIRVFLRWSLKRKSLSMALRVPFYLSMLDLGFLIFQAITIGYLTINHEPMTGFTCKVYATMSTSFTLFHRLVIAGISIITYLRVCKQKICNTGRYDWKLLLPVAILSILIGVMAFNTYGPVIYWCAAEPATVAIPISSISMTIIVLSICMFCYIQTILAIRDIKKQQYLVSESKGVFGKRSTHTPMDSVEIKVTKKVLWYILVFMLQWVPAIPYDIYQFFGRAATWVYCMVIVSINLGPIGNAIFYIVNEGWSRYGTDYCYSADGSENDKTACSTKVDSKSSNNDDNTKFMDIENGSFDFDKN
ncbi:14831_t:CDS:2 [Dentiscutata erythropus]|uniref:14831_t:CDS:1 n=1 Tax=Dentiscutata erythropus TaxID=1348616 RepID=A0A9N9GIY0_9GLOM|nr:14831_t:CDS:2 [Dentiscutata erythropus]